MTDEPPPDCTDTTPPTPTTSTFAPREHGWTPEEAAAALTNHQRPRHGRRPQRTSP